MKRFKKIAKYFQNMQIFLQQPADLFSIMKPAMYFNVYAQKADNILTTSRLFLNI